MLTILAVFSFLIHHQGVLRQKSTYLYVVTRLEEIQINALVAVQHWRRGRER